MTNDIETLSPAAPSATPTEQDLRAWSALSRDEQLRRLRAALAHGDCAAVTADTMTDVLVEARDRGGTRTLG